MTDTLDWYKSVKAVDANVAWAAGWGAGFSGCVRRTTDGGTTWNWAGGSTFDTVFAVNIEAVDANTAWIATIKNQNPWGTYIHKTTNGGATWAMVYGNHDPSAYLDAIKMFDSTYGIALGDPVGGRWMILSTGDGGETWDPIGTEPNQIGAEWGANNGLATIGDTHIWFTPGANGNRVYRTTNGAQTWSYSTLPFTYFTQAIKFLDTQVGVVGGNDASNWPYLDTCASAAARTTNGGTTWTSITIPGTGAISAIAGSGSHLFATHGRNIYYSSDRGLTWSLSLADTCKYFEGMSFVVSGSNFTGWAVAWGGLIAKFSGILQSAEEITGELPKSFALEQNYPNPFNPSASIKYQIPSTDHVTLKVYDLLGREVATLVNEVKQPGTYSVQWDATNVASGIYFYRLQAGDFTQTRKLILLR
jgi:photosystem II stability/assembly factor-like uncharacterized protein